MSSIGEYLRKIRERSGMAVAEVSRSAEISAPYLYQIEDGRRNPSAKVLGRLAQVYRVRVEDLLTRAGLLPVALLPTDGCESRDQRIERAFDYVLRDPGVRAGSRAMQTLPVEAKLAIIRLYERAEGLKILPEEFV
ncbi:MAG: helix-turn-helix transcriptional regulator [Armatimonadetes bacterium]|nr:helix-turn-helix transcriptional regulator [Armatimonadota bacterium]